MTNIVAALAHLWIVIAKLVGWRHDDPPIESTVSPVEPRTVGIRRPRQRKRMDSDHGSAIWSFRTTILDRLDEYFDCIKQVRRLDPEAYGFYARVGFSVAADRYISSAHTINPVYRPTFGGVLYGLREYANEQSVYPSFGYFTKIKHPIGVRPAPDAVIYRFTVVHDNRLRRRLTALSVCHIALYPDGRVEVLPELVNRYQHIVTGKHRKTTRRGVWIKNRNWQVPSWIADIEGDFRNLHANRDHDDEGRAIHDEIVRLGVVPHLFIVTFLTHQEATSSILVRARHHGCVATFGIDLPRAKQFFKDRDKVLAVDGKRKRIFHAVTEHDRHLASGRTTHVGRHYRGTRSFNWQSYRIHIVLPDNNAALQFDAGATDSADARRPDMVEMPEVGAVMAEVLDR